MYAQCLHASTQPSNSSAFLLDNVEQPRSIDKMKSGAMLINVSRGGLVESDALFDALESGRLGAIGLDVYENEGSVTKVVQATFNILFHQLCLTLSLGQVPCFSMITRCSTLLIG